MKVCVATGVSFQQGILFHSYALSARVGFYEPLLRKKTRSKERIDLTVLREKRRNRLANSGGRLRVDLGECYLVETDIVGVFTEALTANVQVVLADQCGTVGADTAVKYA